MTNSNYVELNQLYDKYKHKGIVYCTVSFFSKYFIYIDEITEFVA
jgi:hypothetical protein